jgi:hypothetical protein
MPPHEPAGVFPQPVGIRGSLATGEAQKGPAPIGPGGPDDGLNYGKIAGDLVGGLVDRGNDD